MNNKNGVLNDEWLNNDKTFGCYFSPLGSPIFYVNTINGKFYRGKNTNYSICHDCGKVIGSAMGGWKRHAKSCDLNKREWSVEQLRQIEEQKEWYGSVDTKVKEWEIHLKKIIDQHNQKK